MNKSLATNLIAFTIMIVGLVLPEKAAVFSSIGLFALSGSITNWIAIHMLFEKVPGLYGSGIIPNKFREFKMAIKTMMMEQFFTTENLEKFFASEGADFNLNLDDLASDIPYDKLFAKLKAGVIASPLGGMLQMFGGEETLDQLKEPVIQKMQEAIKEILADDQLKQKIAAKMKESLPVESLIAKVEGIVSARLAELTPQLVKEIIQNMIKEHLGWLVVWGGFFGGLMGLAAHLVRPTV